jgi:hypothetical protein
MGPAQDVCRLRRISPDVQLIEHSGPGTRRLTFGGVSTCKSPLCPLCAPKWQRTRVSEITSAIEHWGAHRVAFCTLTMRHHKGMHLALQHRLIGRAFGHLWSGRAGQELAKNFGGKAESVRAHDRTWSLERGWHPHLHALLFLQSNYRQRPERTPEELEELLWQRWSGVQPIGPHRQGWPGRDSPGALAAALRSFKRFCAKTLERSSELDAGQVTPCWEIYVATYAARELRSCGCYNCTVKRARRLFGSRLLPKLSVMLEVPTAFLDGIRRISDMLESFSERSLAPVRERGVQLESVRAGESASGYLAKLGLELAWSSSKRCNVVDGVTHYPYWALAHLATEHGNPLRVPARGAWRQLFHATRGTQTITFSDRKALGLGPDPYAENEEPPEALPEEYSRMLGTIAGPRWDELKRAQRHGLHCTLHAAHQKGLLETLPYVDPPPGWHGVPASRGPPPPPYVPLEAHERAFRMAAAEKRGGAVVREAWDKRERGAVDRQLWLEEIRFNLAQAGIVVRTWRTTERGCPW